MTYSATKNALLLDPVLLGGQSRFLGTFVTRNDNAIPPRPLGFIQCFVRAFHQGLDSRHAERCPGNSYTHSQIQFLALDSRGTFPEDAAHSLRNDARSFFARLRQQKRKFFSTNSSYGIGIALGRAAHGGDHLQNIVANIMAKTIVDRFEVIHIDDQYRKGSHNLEPQITCKLEYDICMSDRSSSTPTRSMTGSGSMSGTTGIDPSEQ